MNKRDLAKIALIAVILAAAVLLISRISGAQDTAETDIVRAAVRDAALTCYAVEGAYPSSVEYLREHYQLAYDESRYYITYEAFASNRLPDIWVTVKGAKQP